MTIENVGLRIPEVGTWANKNCRRGLKRMHLEINSFYCDTTIKLKQE
jgi:hypothetical protein